MPDLSNPTERNKYWTDFAKQHLVGRKIVAARYMTDKEVNDMGWGCKPVVFQLDDGSVWFPSQDDEGNGPGALFGQIPKEDSITTLPVL